MVSREVSLNKLDEEQKTHDLTYSGRYVGKSLPRYQMPKECSSPRVVHQLIKDELSLDGKAVLNLASFVTTWMEPEAEELIKENINKNFADLDEYPQSHIIQERCVNILAHLFNIPEDSKFIGSSTIGSSEAVMLGGLTHKWIWRNKRKKEKKPFDRPNIVMSTGVQVVWHKFAKYFDVEERLIPVKHGQYYLPPEELENYVDENTICVVGVLGITETGEFDPIEELAEALDTIQKNKGWDIPLHIDAASGGFIAPFAYPDLLWDFRLPRVRSINVSGHKYGLVYPGVGWIIWRDENMLPKDLVFNINYLGGNEPTFTLNFSKGSSHIIAQYYNFMRLGVEGYTRIVQALLSNAQYLASNLEDSGYFELLSNDRSLPVVTASMKKKAHIDVFKLSHHLREKGWIVPAYTMPKDAEDLAVIRVVIREGLSRDMIDMLLKDIFHIIEDKEPVFKKDKKGGKEHRVC